MSVSSPRVADTPPLPSLGVIALNRLAYGPRPGALDFDTWATLGGTEATRLEAFVEQQLAPEAIDDSACEARVTALGLTTLSKTLAQLWTDHHLGGNGNYSLYIQPATETRAATLVRAVYSQRQLAQVLTEFWHNHFSVYAWEGYPGATWAHYDRDVIRPHILGNFRQLLQAVAQSPAMLYYLDNYLSQGAGFNENYARELFELHTLGAENYLGVRDPFSVPKDNAGVAVGYVDNDVYDAARCLTGWRVNDGMASAPSNDGSFLLHAPWHDRANKLVLGKYFKADQTAEQDGNALLDLVATHPGTARFICRKLCRRLVSDNPPEALVTVAAQVFLQNTAAADQLKRVVRVIALSAEFRATWGEKIKRPFEAAISALRVLNAEFTPKDAFFWGYDSMGQPLFSRRPPDGYPDVRASWLNTSSMLNRWNFYNHCLENDLDGLTTNVLAQTPPTVRSPNALADFWISRVLGRALSPAENRTAIEEFIAQGRNPAYDLTTDQITERLPRMVALILLSPDFQLR